MPGKELLLFVEDEAQETFLRPLIIRLGRERGVELTVRVRNCRGGVGATLNAIKEYARHHRRGMESLPDGVVAAVDANCHGYSRRRDELMRRAGELLQQLVIAAIPDPHIERWLLLDGQAFRRVVGKGCQAPDAKCEKDRYKMLLAEGVRDAGVQPLLGGVEYAAELAESCDFTRVSQDTSFGLFIKDFNAWLARCQGSA
jgi:hypothetical protein